jgi:thioesterase domain-containing protein/acyl carrier protein
MTKFYYLVQPVDKDRRFIPIGKPMEGARAIIVDGKGRASPPGAIGEIYIRTPYRTLGYYNQPELTKEVFIVNPFNNDPNDIVYKTGDLGRILDDGNFEFLGREDQQVKVRGVRVELSEIENALRSHAGVKDGVVIEREDGSGTKFLCAYVVLDQAAASAELREHLLKELPEYLIPSAFVILDALPLLPNGKVNRKALPSPDRSHLNLTDGYIPARDSYEFRLAQIWQNILNVHPIGMADNFFELGGHSLLAVQLMSRIQKQFGKTLPLSTLLQSPTIERLAVVLRSDAESLPWTPLVKMQPEGTKPPFFFLHPAGGDVLLYAMLTMRLGRERPIYGLQAQGINGEEAPYRSIPEMARLYLEEIRKVQPQGPYFLCGASMGGMLAFELAQQVRAEGQEVALLALIDTRSSVPAEQLDWDDAHILYDRLSEYFPLSLEHLQSLSPEHQLIHIMEEARKRNYLYPGYGIRQARAFLSVFRNNVRAVIAYEPQFYPGCVTLFSTSASMRFAKDPQDQTRGWYKLARKVVVHEISGNHSNMLDEPHVQVPAELINAYLQQAEPALAG